MGGDRTTTETSSQAKQTPEEERLNKLALERQEAIQGQQIQAQQQGFDLVSRVLAGEDLSGNLGRISRGIDPEVTQGLVDQSLTDVRTNFQGSGLLDSGIALEAGSKVAGDIRRASEEFNINSLFNLLGLASGNQANLQQGALASSQGVGSRLAGLRSVTSNQTQTAMNPFLKSFQTSLGQYVGGGFAGGGGGGGGGAAGGSSSSGGMSPQEIEAFVAAGCWVASELFGGWHEPKTVSARFYVNNIAPVWFKKVYLKYGERFAKFISDKPIIKKMIKPIFEYFANVGGYNGQK